MAPVLIGLTGLNEVEREMTRDRVMSIEHCKATGGPLVVALKPTRQRKVWCSTREEGLLLPVHQGANRTGAQRSADHCQQEVMA